MIQPRPHQERALSLLRQSYQTGHRAPCLIMPCAAGKTTVAAMVVERGLQRGTRSLFVADRETLIEQTVATFNRAGVTDIRVIQADRDDGNPTAPVTVASAQTLRMPGWLDRLPAADLIIWDECHGVAAATYRDVLARHPATRLLGLTATPVRGDNKPLDMFDDLVVGATIRELTDLGFLARCRVMRPPEGAVDSNEIAIDPVTAYQRYANGQRAGVFCLTRKQAAEYVDAFTAAGISAAVVTAGTKDRRGILARFSAGQFRVLISVGCLVQGWDDPGCAVAILARDPNLGLWIQICGRVLRPHPDKREGLIVDLCGAFWEHGMPDADRTYSLTGKAISTIARDSFGQCKECGSMFIAGPRACPHCGAVLPVRAMPSPRVVGVELQDSGSPKPPPKLMRPKPIMSKHPGRCSRCGQAFPSGTPIRWAKDRPVTHEVCP